MSSPVDKPEVSSNEVFVTTLSADLLQKAEAELNEKDKWRDRDIQALRDMVVAHKGLCANTKSCFLLRFLRARKFDYDRAYTLLVNYYTIRALNADTLKVMLPSDPSICRALNSGFVSILPHRDREGRSIFYFRPGKWNPLEFSIFEILRANILSLELAITDEATQVSGIIIIGNLSDVGFVHLRNLDRNYARIMTSLLQVAEYFQESIYFRRSLREVCPNIAEEAFPMRFKGIHFINEPSVFGTIFAIMKPFLKEKTVSRLMFHGSSLDSLHKQFDRSMLPAELGGQLPHGDQLAEEWKNRVISHEAMYAEMAHYSITLPRDNIVQGATIGSSVDGPSECIVGTYRRLNVD